MEFYKGSYAKIDDIIQLTTGNMAVPVLLNKGSLLVALILFGLTEGALFNGEVLRGEMEPL